MSVTHGADIEGLRTSARELADTAQILLTVNVRLTHRVHDFTWNGPDAARFRLQWETEYSPALGQVSGALNRAASEIAEQAADQERASSADGATSSATDDLQTRLNLQRDVLVTLAGLGEVGRAALVHPDAWRTLTNFNNAWTIAEHFKTPLQSAASSVLGVLSIGVNAHGLVKGVTEGDYPAIAQNVAPLAAHVLMKAGPAAAVSTAWGAGTLVGNQINKAMDGTTYGDRVAAKYDALYEWAEPAGAAGSIVAGVVATPAIMVTSGLDMLLPDHLRPGADDDVPPIP